MAELLTREQETEQKRSGAAHRAASRVAGKVGRHLRYTLPGAWVALAFLVLSLTPSLLPRPPAYQGAVSGLSAVIGYALGVLGAWLWREFADRDPRPPSRRSWQLFFAVAALALVVAVVLSLRWQRQLRALLEVAPPAAASYLLTPVVAVVIFVVVVAAGRGVRWAYRRLAGYLERRIGARAARASALVALTCTAALVLSGVVFDGLVSMADRSFALLDTRTTAGAVQPTSTLRSGGPGSLVSWESLGRQGRRFTGNGPTAKEIADFTGSTAEEPIRAYAGYASADNTEDRATLAVDELERAGGFDRSYVLVVTTTGTGIVEPSAASSFEYLTGGDSAIVATQYSHLPSWLSYLVDRDEARAAGRDLFDEVYGRWSQRPPDDRPKLMVYGESLGSFGGENAFSGERDLANRTSGALYVGPPSFNPLYSDIVEDRDPGSPQVEPTYNDGRIIRFSGRPREGIPPESSPWPGSRVLYMQHATDPITWWSTDLVLQEPDWLKEPPGRGVLDDMTWIPFVTFWQVSADLALSFSTPPGHGHVYTGEHVDGWAAVLQPAGWSEDRAAELRELVLAEPG